MSFAKNVNRYYKWVLGSIVAVMAISLVVSGSVNPSGRDPEKPFATIYRTVTVTAREWDQAWAKAGAWYRLKAVRKIDEGTDYNSVQFQPLLFKFREGPGLLAFHELFKLSQEDMVAAARELVILGLDARSKQVRASEEEVNAIVEGFLHRAEISLSDGEEHRKFADMYFKATPEAFLAAVRDSIMIEKALSLDVGGCTLRYEDLYNEQLSKSRSVKVLVAGIDGTKVPGDIVEVTDDQVRARFEAERENYKMPAKVQLEYLQASFEDFLKKVKDPTPEEIQKYYDEHQKEFPKKDSALEPGHREDDGHDHGKKLEYKTIDEVREEIIKKIKDRLAKNEAWNTIKNVSSNEKGAPDFADAWYKLLDEEKAKEPKDPKSVKERALARTGPILGELKEQYKARDVELRIGVTQPFSEHEREPFEAELGKPAGASDPMDWAFKGPVGEVSNQVYHSDKGYALLRIAQKIEGYPTDLTGPIREKIRQEIHKAGAAERAKRLADEIVTRIRANGAAEIARLKKRPDVKIQHSAYLTQTSPDGDSGLAPVSLAQQVKTKLLKPAADPAAPEPAGGTEAQAIHGDAVGGDRKDWSFVVVVEDSVQVAPEIKDDEFMMEVRRREAEEVAKARVKRAETLVAGAEWTEADKKPAE